MAKKVSAKAPVVEEYFEEAAPAEAASERVYRGTQELDHDLFKLKVAKMRKNVAFNEGEEDWVEFEHCHIFHTIDSNGKQQTACTPVGGHFHEVTVDHKPGQVPTLRISPPMRYVLKKIAGRKKKVAEELGYDTHTHNVEYLGSQRIKPRKMNPEAARLESAIRIQQEPTVAGSFEA